MRSRDIMRVVQSGSVCVGGWGGALTLREYASRERCPLADLHDAILELLAKRDDIAVYGAKAVDAHGEESAALDLASPPVLAGVESA
jgi:hypothetical protein